MEINSPDSFSNQISIMRILITGDIIPTKCNEWLFEKADATSLLGETLVELFENADFKIGNLEGNLTESSRSIIKSGPAIKASVKSVNGYKAVGFDALSLANNHILDYGTDGFIDTIEALKGAGIAFFGGGINTHEAKKPYIFSDKVGTKVAVYACAEHEFTAATDNSPGANIYDECNVMEDISRLKKTVDYLIVLYHGAKEYYRYPVPYVQSRCRKMVEKGANLVLCQHSHCIGCYEKHKNGEILYGQGNFLFNKIDNDYRHSGLIVQVDVKGSNSDVQYIPVVMNGCGIKKAKDAELASIIDGFLIRSKQIRDSNFVVLSYKCFCNQKIYSYYKHLFGLFAPIIQILCRLGQNNHFILRYKAALLNDLRCEAHRDIIITALSNDLDNAMKKK